MDPDDLKLVNCANCGRDTLAPGFSYLAKETGLPAFGGRIAGRPWCRPCIKPARRPTGYQVGTEGPGEDTSAEQANAIRHMEDAGCE